MVLRGGTAHTSPFGGTVIQTHSSALMGTARTERARPFLTRMLALAGALVLATALLTVGGAATPAAAATLEQCNGVGGGGGEGYDCAVTITNTYDAATGIGSSTVRTIACSGPANTDPLPTCADSGILFYPELTETVEQCNGTVNGGRSIPVLLGDDDEHDHR